MNFTLAIHPRRQFVENRPRNEKENGKKRGKDASLSNGDGEHNRQRHIVSKNMSFSLPSRHRLQSRQNKRLNEEETGSKRRRDGDDSDGEEERNHKRNRVSNNDTGHKMNIEGQNAKAPPQLKKFIMPTNFSKEIKNKIWNLASDEIPTESHGTHMNPSLDYDYDADAETDDSETELAAKNAWLRCPLLPYPHTNFFTGSGIRRELFLSAESVHCINV